MAFAFRQLTENFSQKYSSKFLNSFRPIGANLGGIGINKVNLANVLLFLVVLTIAKVSDTEAARRIYRVKSNSAEKLNNLTTKKCLADRDPKLRIMADQLCEFCHEMFSHVQPNLRAECSSKCYKNAQFRKCLKMYTALPEGHPGGAATETKRNDEEGEEERLWRDNKRNGNSRRGKHTITKLL